MKEKEENISHKVKQSLSTEIAVEITNMGN